MCLISVCPAGTKKYTDEVESFIRSGFITNGDGSGFMYKKKGDSFVYVKKGFKDPLKLIEALKQAKLSDEDELVFHHRIGTSGLISAENTHPFVISNDHDTIINTNIKVDKPCIVHNGMFSVPRFQKMNPNFSDTYAFTRYILYHTINLFKEETQLFLDNFDQIIGWSKMCVLFPDRDLIMTGNFDECNGYFHSNQGYKYHSHRDVGGKTESKDFIWSGKTNTPKLELPSGILPCAPAAKCNRMPITLEGTDIIITQFNYDHFFYTNKNVKDSLAYEFEGFDQDALKNILWSSKSGTSLGTSGITVGPNALKDCFYYHPKKEYEAYYKEYLKLFSELKPSKNNMKKLFKILNTNKFRQFEYLITINDIKATKLTYLNFFAYYYKSIIPAHDSLVGTYFNNLVSKFNDPVVNKRIANEVQVFVDDTSTEVKNNSQVTPPDRIEIKPEEIDTGDVCMMD